MKISTISTHQNEYVDKESQSIDDLDLSNRLKNFLKRNGIFQVDQLLKKSEAEMQSIYWLGEKSYLEIKELKEKLSISGNYMIPEMPLQGIGLSDLTVKTLYDNGIITTDDFLNVLDKNKFGFIKGKSFLKKDIATDINAWRDTKDYELFLLNSGILFSNDVLKQFALIPIFKLDRSIADQSITIGSLHNIKQSEVLERCGDNCLESILKIADSIKTIDEIIVQMNLSTRIEIIVNGRYSMNMSYKAIGDFIGLTGERVRQIFCEFETKLFNKLENSMFYTLLKIHNNDNDLIQKSALEAYIKNDLISLALMRSKLSQIRQVSSDTYRIEKS